jgi:hypothetical protein
MKKSRLSTGLFLIFALFFRANSFGVKVYCGPVYQG